MDKCKIFKIISFAILLLWSTEKKVWAEEIDSQEEENVDNEEEEDNKSLKLNMVSQYKGVMSLDMTCELFYTWFKVNLLGMIGGVKEQINLDGIGLPFTINSDGLLARSRELAQKLDDLKVTKMRWSNF